MADTGPNVIWIMADEFRTDALSCYGTPFPAVATPNIDRIAENGVLFANCFCNAPICVPARTCEMAATYAEVTGVYGNEGAWTSYPYDRALVTFPQHFAANGYRTFNFGKTHLPVAMRPWQHDDHAGAELGRFYEGVEQGPDPDEILTPTLKAAIGGTFPGPVEFPGDKLTRNAVRWLESEAASAGPFLARISYLQPHSPVLPPEPYASRYRDLPWPDAIEGAPGCAFEQRFAEVCQAQALSPAQVRRVWSDYYGLVAWLDAQVGAILDALKRARLGGNTIMVLEGDHGVSLGERGRLQKHTFFPEVHRIPRLIAWPGVLPKGQIRSDLSEAIDLARTLCRLCGMEPAGSFRGRDVFADAPPQHVFSTIGYGLPHSYALPNQAIGTWSEGLGWPRRSCVRTRRYRLDMTTVLDGRRVERAQEDPYLADLALDPAEAGNRAGDPVYADVLEELRAALLRHIEDGYEPPAVPEFSPRERGPVN